MQKAETKVKDFRKLTNAELVETIRKCGGNDMTFCFRECPMRKLGSIECCELLMKEAADRLERATEAAADFAEISMMAAEAEDFHHGVVVLPQTDRQTAVNDGEVR